MFYRIEFECYGLIALYTAWSNTFSGSFLDAEFEFMGSNSMEYGKLLYRAFVFEHNRELQQSESLNVMVCKLYKTIRRPFPVYEHLDLILDIQPLANMGNSD